MMRMTRMWLVGAALVAVATGCNCNGGNPPGACEDPLTIAFTGLNDNQDVNSPVDVAIAVVGPNGVVVELGSATLATRASSATDYGTAVDGAISGSKATFPGVVLGGPGGYSAKAEVVQKGCTKAFAKTISLNVPQAPVPPRVSSVRFPQDVNDSGTLNASELPGTTPIRVSVIATNADQTDIQIRENDENGRVLGGPIPYAVGGVSVDLTNLTVGQTVAVYAVFAQILKGGVGVNTVAVNPDGKASIRVNRSAPICTITTKLHNGPSDDASTSKAGFQLNATANVVGATSASLSIVNGAASGTLTPVSDEVGFAFDLPATGENAYSLVVSASDVDGNSCTATATVTVDYLPPFVTITSPVSVDGGAITYGATPLTVTAAITGVEDGGIAAASVGGTPVGSNPISNNIVSIDVPFSSNGTKHICVSATDLAGNRADACVDVVVTLTVCGVTVSRPLACPALITSRDLSNGVYQFIAQSSCNSVAATVKVNGSSQCSTTTSATGVINCNVPVSASGSLAFEVDVANTGGAPDTVVTCAATVDLATPVITTPPPTNPPPTTINAQQDTQPATPGAQRQLAFNAVVPANGHAEVCIDQSAGTGGSACPGNAGYFSLATNVTSPANGFTFPEGEYNIIVVVVAGGNTNSSTPVRVRVDVTRPCVQSLRLPQDSPPADNRLNAVELGAALPQLAFTQPGSCSDAAGAPNPTVRVFKVLNGAVDRSAVLNVGNNAAFTTEITTDLTTANEVDLVAFVELTDWVGNTNQFTTSAAPDVKSFRVDKVAPTCLIAQPTSGVTLGQAQAPGNVLDVVITTSADVASGGVTARMAATGVTTLNLTATAQSATSFVAPFSISGEHVWAIDATCTDASGNVSNAQQSSATVDLVAPSCSFTSPTNAAPYNVSTITTSLNVTGAEGQNVIINTSLSGSPLGSLPVSGGVATGDLSYQNGTQTITGHVEDAAGNACTATVSNLIVNWAGCSLSLLNLYAAPSGGSWLNRSNTTPTGATTATGTISINSDCHAGQTVTLERISPTPSVVATSNTSLTGDASFAAVSLVDGETYRVSINNGAGLITPSTPGANILVDLGAPSSSGTTVNGVAVTTPLIYFVANVDNRNVETGVAGYFADGNADQNDSAQATVVLNGIAGAHVGATSGKAEVLLNGSVVANGSAAVTSDPQTITLNVTLPHGSTGPFIVRITDPGGNQTDVVSATATIDVKPPADPWVLPTVATQTLTDARAGQVTISWDPVYNDGATSTSGAHAGYDVRWTTSSVPGNAAMAAAINFFGSSAPSTAAAYRESDSAWSATRISRLLTLPPVNTYYIKVRAFDQVGNYSPWASAPTALPNLWTQVTVTNPSTDTTAASHTFGQNIASANVSGDSNPELIVAAPNRGPTGSTNIGSVFVFSGPIAGAISTCTAGSCVELQPYDSAAGLFGTDVSASGNVGDVATEGRADLIVAQPTFQTSVGRAFLYFGTTQATIDGATFIEFRGTTSSLFASAARIIKDIDGDGLDEIAFSAHGELANQGRIYIFRGRSADPNFNPATVGSNWFNSRTANDGAGHLYIPTSAATWVLEGPLAVAAGGNQYGRLRYGITSLGDVTGDGHSDFVIPLAKETVNKVMLYSGGIVADGGTGGAGTNIFPATSNAVIQTISGPNPPATPSTTTDGFGRSVAAGLDIYGATGLDMLVAYPLQNRVHLFADLTATGIAGGNPTTTIQGASGALFGYHTSVADLNSDSRPDLVVGEAPNTAGGLPPGQVWVVWQHADRTFDTAVDGATVRYWISELRNTVAGSREGRITLLADTNADQLSDIILGDDAKCMVRIWR